MNEAKKARNVNREHALRAAHAHVHALRVARNGDAKRLRGVTVELVERNFDGLADARAEERERVSKGAAVLQVR